MTQLERFKYRTKLTSQRLFLLAVSADCLCQLKYSHTHINKLVDMRSLSQTLDKQIMVQSLES